MQDGQGGRRSADDSSRRRDVPGHDDCGAAMRRASTYDHRSLRQAPPNDTDVKPEDLDKLLRAYQSGPAEKQKGIIEFVERHGFSPSQVYKLAFKNGFTKLGEKEGTSILPAEAERILREAA